MNFVDVILPLSVPNYYTYSVSEEQKKVIQIGKRVVVQFGKSRLYTALICKIHDSQPEYLTKKIEYVLDEFPVVRELQLKFWEWIHQYYMCYPGEVMLAALPSAYQLISETRIVLGSNEIDFGKLNDNEFLIAEALQIQKSLSIGEISEILGIPKIQPYIKSLLEKGLIELEEEVKEKYKPKVEKFIRLNTTLYSDETSLASAFAKLSNSPKQEDLLLRFISEKGFNFSDYAAQKNNFLKNHQFTENVVKGLVDKGIIIVEELQVDRINPFENEVQSMPLLSEPQKLAYDKIGASFSQGKNVLLHGVTGSGKTELYFHLIQDTLDNKKQVLYLLPEIALTTQLIQRLQKVFGDKVGVFHSRFSTNERAEVWADLLKENGRYQIVIGARSSLFLPFKNLGLVIIDEEHETSFKQFDPAPRYHARDAAMYLAHLSGAPCVLGTATPSIESYFNTKNDKLDLVELKVRYSGILMPEIICADIQEERKKKTMTSIFSSLLKNSIEEVLNKNEQVILFQNRRGFAPLLECNACGHVENCTRCDVSLTYHKITNQLRCHYCGYVQNVKLTCSACGSIETGFKGFGTEMIQEELGKIFPKAKIGRMDTDTTKGKNAYRNLLHQFENHEIDILVGTQMLTKGLDFSNVSLVGILNADQMLQFPDFRAYEKAYQLMAQVSGRAGRRNTRGKVVIQTYQPFHQVVQNVLNNNYLELYNNEILHRKNFKYPPFYRLIKLTIKHSSKNVVDICAQGIADALITQLSSERILGPEYPAINRINNLFQKNILLKVEKNLSIVHVKKILQNWIDTYKKDVSFKSVRFIVDVDPC